MILLGLTSENSQHSNSDREPFTAVRSLFCIPLFPLLPHPPFEPQHDPPYPLLADDDRILSNLLRQYFEGEGFAVSQVFDGAEAVSAAGEEVFDIIVVDVMMPVYGRL